LTTFFLRFKGDFRDGKELSLKNGKRVCLSQNISGDDYAQFIVEILSSEGTESSKIEGEILDRESLQSSIRHIFGFDHTHVKKGKEKEMAKLLHDVYETFDLPLTHAMLGRWHKMVMTERNDVEEIGKCRTHPEPTQIVSNRYGSSFIYFEAPPSDAVPKEMERYLKWMNKESLSLPILARAAIGHLYFENIHPFEDGNGRIGRVLVEKILSQGAQKLALIAVSQILEKRKKEYYSQLQKCNRSLDASEWIEFFGGIILEAQDEAMELLYFLIAKAKLLQAYSGQINARQEKVLLRMFAEGPRGFKGGLSAENYLAITKTSRATATRDLNDLVEKGILVKIGKLRHTRYHLNLKRHFNNLS